MLVSHQVRSLPCVQPLACRDLTHGHAVLAFPLALVIRGRGADGIDNRTLPQRCGASCFILTGSFRRSCNDSARVRLSRIIKAIRATRGQPTAIEPGHLDRNIGPKSNEYVVIALEYLMQLLIFKKWLNAEDIN